MKHILVLPAYGTPYIYKSGRDAKLEDLQKCVGGGYIEGVKKTALVINPDFVRENPRWEMAQRLLSRALMPHCYYNEDGDRVARSLAVFQRIPGQTPFVMGNVVCVITDLQMRKFGVLPETLMLVGDIDGAGDPPIFEPEDEADALAKVAECEANGWDSSMIERSGQIYRARV